jgi:hypothetical protein
MAADPVRELHELIDQLSNEEASALLVNARRIAARRRLTHEIPTMHIAPPITNIDDFVSDIFPPDESVDDFDNAIRQWREEGSSQRG